MITLAWARLLRAERPSTPHLYTDHRGTAHVIVPGPDTWPCHGPDCYVDTGSEHVNWCSHDCHSRWCHQQLNTAAVVA